MAHRTDDPDPEDPGPRDTDVDGTEPDRADDADPEAAQARLDPRRAVDEAEERILGPAGQRPGDAGADPDPVDGDSGTGTNEESSG